MSKEETGHLGVDKIVIDRETWGNQELFEVICSRYFDLGNQGQYPPSWEVEGIGGETSEQLLRLNRHLGPMGVVGYLEDSNPPVLTIAKLPQGRNVMQTWHQGLLWAVMATFLTWIGSHWTTRYGYSTEAFSSLVFGGALLYFTIPIVTTIIIAGQVRMAVARRFNVDLGHLVPVVLPIPGWWAFGLVGVISQTKPDLVTMPNRQALGSIELAAPLTMSISGLILSITGLMMTPSEPPALAEAPMIFDVNLLAGSLAESWMGDEFSIRMQWLHPLGIAGIALSLIGWGLMLPIPGLPGDRILQAVIGTKEMREGNTQTSIFMIVLIAMVAIFATADWSPWIFLAFFAAWMRFNPDNAPQPVVLDEFEGLEERHRSRFVALALMILLAGLPGAVPSSLLEDYDSGISTESWPGELSFDRGEESLLILEISPSGVMPVSGWLQMRIEGPKADEWRVNSSCESNFMSRCNFSEVTQASPVQVDLSISPPELDFSTHLLRILVEVNGYEMEHRLTLFSWNHTGPTQPFWEIHSDEGGKQEICTGIRTMEEGWSINVEDPYWSLLNGTNLSVGVNDVCMQGYQGAIKGSSATDPEGRVLGPKLILDLNGSTIGPWEMGIDDTGKLLQSSEGEWNLPENFISEGQVLFHSDTGSPFCPSSEVNQEVDTGENWSTVLGNYSALELSGNLSGHGLLNFGLSGWLAICDGLELVDTFRINMGHDIHVSAGLGIGIDEDHFEVHNRGKAPIVLSVEIYGDAIETSVWELEIPEELDAGASSEITVRSIGNQTLDRAVWVTADSSEITIHLSARCPYGGC